MRNCLLLQEGMAGGRRRRRRLNCCKPDIRTDGQKDIRIDRETQKRVVEAFLRVWKWETKAFTFLILLIQVSKVHGNDEERNRWGEFREQKRKSVKKKWNITNLQKLQNSEYQKSRKCDNWKQGRIHGCPSRVRVGRGSDRESHSGSELKKLKNVEKVKRGPTDRPTNIAGCRVALHATKNCLLKWTSYPR